MDSSDQGDSDQTAQKSVKHGESTKMKESNNNPSQHTVEESDTLMCPHCDKTFPAGCAVVVVNPDTLSVSKRPADTQKEDNSEDDKKWQEILSELRNSEIKDCVPSAENLMKKSQNLHSDVLTFFCDLVKSLKDPKEKQTDQHSQPEEDMDTSSSSQPDNSPDQSQQPTAAKSHTQEDKKNPDCDKPAVPHGSSVKTRSKSQSDPRHQETEIGVDQKKWQYVRKRMTDSEIQNCVPGAEKVIRKRPIHPDDVVDLLGDVVDCLPPKKANTENNSVSTPSRKRVGSTVTFSRVVTGQTFGAHDTILEKVTKMKGYPFTHADETNLQQCDIIIVFCPIASRIGSDVEAVKRHEAVTSTNKKVIVVLMHHIRDKEFSPGEKKWFEDPRFVLEVHVLFHETQRGLLQCALNDQAVSKIQKVLNKHSKYPWS